MAFIYTQSDLKSRINAGIQGKVDMLVSAQDLMNEAVREVKNEVRLRSSRRKATLTPNLMSDFYEYQCPSDLDALSIIDIPAHAQRADGEFVLVPSEQFRRSLRRGDIAVDDKNGARVLLINSSVEDTTQSMPSLASADVDGVSWTAFGDGDAVQASTDDYVRETGSIEYNITAAGGTTAGIYLNGFQTIDLTDFIGKTAAVLVQARITSTTGITNFKMRLGSGPGTYYEFTATARNDGTAFTTGWNEIRFDLSSYTETGSPDPDDIAYIALYMTKSVSKVSESGYMFNGAVAKRGKYHDVVYYSKYGWQSSAGAYKENSTAIDDVLVADTDEYDLIVKKGRALASAEVDMTQVDRNDLKAAYEAALTNYRMRNPSEEKTTISTYHDYD